MAMLDIYEQHALCMPAERDIRAQGAGSVSMHLSPPGWEIGQPPINLETCFQLLEQARSTTMVGDQEHQLLNLAVFTERVRVLDAWNAETIGEQPTTNGEQVQQEPASNDLDLNLENCFFNFNPDENIGNDLLNLPNTTDEQTATKSAGASIYDEQPVVTGEQLQSMLTRNNSNLDFHDDYFNLDPELINLGIDLVNLENMTNTPIATNPSAAPGPALNSNNAPSSTPKGPAKSQKKDKSHLWFGNELDKFGQPPPSSRNFPIPPEYETPPEPKGKKKSKPRAPAKVFPRAEEGIMIGGTVARTAVGLEIQEIDRSNWASSRKHAHDDDSGDPGPSKRRG